MKTSWLIALAFALTPVSALASDSEVALGTMPNFALTDATGNDVVLYDNSAAYLGTVIAFTSVDCPIAKLYAPRLARLATEYEAEGIRFLAINPNMQDTPEEVRERAAAVGIPFPILLDPMQAITASLKVERTTEVFLVNAEMNIVYRGAIDDQYGVGTQKPNPRNEYLIAAIESLLENERPDVARTDAPGCLISHAKNSADLDLTYYEDIAPILNKQCMDCHRPGQVGPMSFATYDDASGWAGMIAEVVDQGRMPPWHANPQHGAFENRRLLTETEKAKLLTWATNGAKAGDPNDAPEPPQYEDDHWIIGTPDLVLELPEEQQIPAEGTVPYRYAVVDPELSEDHWVQAIEIRPTNLEVTHHVLVLLIPAGKTVNEVVGSLNGDAFLDAGYFAVSVPGARPNIWPEGTAKFLPKGSKFLFQLHYTPNGLPETDRSKMAFRFTDGPIEHEVKTTGIGNTRLKIAPDSKATFYAKHRFEKPIELLSMFPHMHTRGAAFSYELIGFEEDQVLLDVPKYDFNWQNFYRYQEPVRIEAGESIFCTASYDNTLENPFNPDPEAAVYWGDQTWEEMMIGYIDYIEYEE